MFGLFKAILDFFGFATEEVSESVRNAQCKQHQAGSKISQQTGTYLDSRGRRRLIKTDQVVTVDFTKGLIYDTDYKIIGAFDRFYGGTCPEHLRDIEHEFRLADKDTIQLPGRTTFNVKCVPYKTTNQIDHLNHCLVSGRIVYDISGDNAGKMAERGWRESKYANPHTKIKNAGAIRDVIPGDHCDYIGEFYMNVRTGDIVRPSDSIIFARCHTSEELRKMYEIRDVFQKQQEKFRSSPEFAQVRLGGWQEATTSNETEDLYFCNEEATS